jgi:hypothetical protein
MTVRLARTLVVFLAVTACGTTEKQPTTASRSVVESLQSRNEMAARIRPDGWDNLAGTMPNGVVLPGGKAPAYQANMLAIGSVVEVKPGFSLSWTIDANGGLTENRGAFNAAKAPISVVEVTISAAQSRSRRNEPSAQDTLKFGLSFPAPADMKRIEADLRAHSGLAVLLFRGGLSATQPTLWDVLGDGDFLGFVDNEKVTFPVLDPTLYPKDFVPADLTVTGLLALADR